MENNPGLNAPTQSEPKPDITPIIETSDIPRLAVNAAGIGTWFLDQQTQTFLPSARMKELHGYHPEEEMSFQEVLLQIPVKYRNKVIRTLTQAASMQEPFYMEYPTIGFHDQKLRWLRVMGGADQQGNISHFSGVAMDITLQKQNELRKNKFIGMVSHELKTPLTSLKAYIQLLSKWARQQKDNFSMGTLSKLEKQVKKMTSMINGFLNLSGAESGKIQLNKNDFEIEELLAEIIEESKDHSPDQPIHFSHSQQTKLYADREKIEQVVINLISNAVKYSYPGSPIVLSCYKEESFLKISVKDSGIGIAPEDIEKLFKAHSRIKTSQTESISGFGIGLYLCQQIIKYHQGDIGVESQQGQGSTFWFTLPLSQS
ncbi:signal transduction histidine kinase [Pedobacter sp. CG_S7]|uniref:sensor histidine kinase n=1 Tax=Pedobacter sp. CG_S7 TaxID=3143930 RepID=UPI00339AA477